MEAPDRRESSSPADVAAVFAGLDPPLWLVTSIARDVRSSSGRPSRPGGLIATFVSNASIVARMPRVVLGISKQHHTWSLIESSGRFALHLLHEEQIELVWNFGLRSGRDVDKFAGLAWHEGKHGSPIVDGTLGWLECRVEATLDSGDRSLYLAEVVDGRLERKKGTEREETGADAERGQPLSIRRALELAGESTADELRRQMKRDGDVDARAIAAWRARGASRAGS